MKSLALPLVVLALIIGALWWHGRPPRDPREVPVSPYTWGKFSGSTAPVETSLHDYDSCSGPCAKRFHTTGKSITFSFLEAYYWYRSKQRKKPQKTNTQKKNQHNNTPTSFLY